MLQLLLFRRLCTAGSAHQLCYSSCVYASRDLCQTTLAAPALTNGWTKHIIPAPVDRLAGVVDFKIIYAKETTPKFLFSRSRDFHEVEIDYESEKIVHVSAGRRHLAILTTHGNVYLTDTEHILSGSQQGKHVPLKVTSTNCHQVVCGLDHTLLLSKDGLVFSHGWGADGQTGTGDEATLANFTPAVGDIQSKMILQVETCVDSCFALADDGTVFAWGNNEYGQLGVDSTELQLLVPKQCHIPSLSEQIVQISSCGTFTCCLTGFYSLLASGDVYYWGTLEPIDQCKKGIKLLYSSKTESGPVLSLHGGLHYIVARCRAALLIWGYYPGYSSNAELQPLKIFIPPSILSVSPMLHELVILINK